MKFNTENMRTIASEINSLATSYQSIITNIYKELSEMNSSGKWTGNSAKKYIDTTLQDKTDLVAIGNRIKSFSKAINDNATLLESRVSTMERNESL